MADYEEIKKANAEIKNIALDTKNGTKAYAEVNQRVKAFRMLYPEGYIKTEIVSIADGVVIMRAECGYYYGTNSVPLAVGFAYEKENSTLINKTSYIENCETSAVGRALGFLGLGIDTSIASYEEVRNAIDNQEEKPISKSEKEGLIETAKTLGLDYKTILADVGWVEGKRLTREQYGRAMNLLISIKHQAKEKKENE